MRIVLKELLDKDHFEIIRALEILCCEQDRSSLKLELDYKLSAGVKGEKANAPINEFMYFDGKDLVGYIGICSFGGSTPEINGMVHPAYRRRGIFTALYSQVLEELRKREAEKSLLLCDRNSTAGQLFIKTTGAVLEHTEYEMVLNQERQMIVNDHNVIEVSLRKASNADADEVARQNAIYFGSDYEEHQTILPEEEERRGMIVYIAEKENQVVGKVHLQMLSGEGAIFGLGVLPEYRSRGLGRQILSRAVETFKQQHVKSIMLQVEAKNANALNLYKSCGFEERSVMDYFQL